MALSDVVAQQVLGEINTLSKKIDAQFIALDKTAKLTADAANSVVGNVRQALAEAENVMKDMQKGSRVDIRFKEQLWALGRIEKVIGDAREQIPTEVRRITHEAQRAANETLEVCKANSVNAFHAAGIELLNAEIAKSKRSTLALGAGIAAIAALLSVMVGTIGYSIGQQTSFSMTHTEAQVENKNHRQQ